MIHRKARGLLAKSPRWPRKGDTPDEKLYQKTLATLKEIGLVRTLSAINGAINDLPEDDNLFKVYRVAYREINALEPKLLKLFDEHKLSRKS